VNFAGRFGAVLAGALLAACATVQQPAVPSASDSLAGRLTVKVDATPTSEARNVTAVFDLQGNPQQGRLDLSTPLGTILAQARWAPGSVVLASSQGETKFANLDALTREVLGESLPVAALFDWLRGRPWPGAASAPNTPPAEAGFKQLGWVVGLARIDEGWVTARRDQLPVVTVRAKLDRP
jgi:outer membrane lipoprotein LolB